MTDNRKEMTKSIVVLSVIALISGLLLSIVSQVTALTKEEKDRKIYKTLNEIYSAEQGFERLAEDGEYDKVTGIFKAKGTEYYIVLATGKGKNGDLEMYVGFEGRQIENVLPGKVNDDPGYKERIYAESYLNQFKVNIDGNLFDGGGSGFDSAAGATYTSKGALEAIINAINAYKQYTAEGAL